MHAKRRGPSNTRVDYRWRVDRERGFEKTSMIYDVDGKLVAIDYESAERPRTDPSSAFGTFSPCEGEKAT